ncbi:MAG: haloacid dehalogenase [Promethearchaeota archaeon]|nr:MAG: haloacid dehalogenase [Candidatus Lokiarchaeota archaeon]
MKISLIVYDFDGVMTNNKVLVMQNGQEAIFCNRDDGWAVRKIKDMGITQLILSSEENSVVVSRALKLSIQCISGCSNKEKRLRQFCRDENILLAETIFVGNGLNDLDVMKIVGMPVAPANANPEVLKIAKFITKAKGGEGIILELYKWLTENKL